MKTENDYVKDIKIVCKKIKEDCVKIDKTKDPNKVYDIYNHIMLGACSIKDICDHRLFVMKEMVE